MTEAMYIAQPIRSMQTMLRVIARADSRLPDVIPDGLFGSDTEAAVRAFQQAYALPITSTVDEATWRKLVSVFTECAPSVLPAAPLALRLDPGQSFAPGSRNLHLYLIQSMFLALRQLYANVPPLTVTGVHDAPSVAAVMWLQQLANLPATGAVDAATWAHLSALYALCTANGERRD